MTNIVLWFIGVGIGLFVNFLAEVLPRKYRKSITKEIPIISLQFNIGHKLIRTILVLIIYVILTMIIWYVSVNILEYLLYLCLFVYLGLIFIIDLEYGVVLNSMIIIGVVLSTVFGFYQNGFVRTIQGGTVGFMAFIVLFSFGKLLMPYLANLRQIDLQKQALSKNDVLLGLILGLFLGWGEIMNGLFFTFILLGIAGVLITFYMIAKRKYNPNLSVPLGPFIVLGGVISFMIDINF